MLWDNSDLGCLGLSVKKNGRVARSDKLWSLNTNIQWTITSKIHLRTLFQCLCAINLGKVDIIDNFKYSPTQWNQIVKNFLFSTDSLNGKVYTKKILLLNNLKTQLKICTNIFNHAPKIWDNTTCKHGRPYWIWIHCSFWQLKTLDPVSQVHKQLRFKWHKSTHVELCVHAQRVRAYTRSLIIW